jgi:hypothetical protein
MMNLIESVQDILLWAIGVLATIVFVATMTGYVVEKMAQERIEKSQYGMRCSK